MAPVSAASGSGASATTDDTIFGVPKWALAVAAGGLVAAGVAYYVLSSSKPGKKKDGKKKGKKGSAKSTASNASSTTSTPSKQETTPKVTVKDVGAEEDALVRPDVGLAVSFIMFIETSDLQAMLRVMKSFL